MTAGTLKHVSVTLPRAKQQVEVVNETVEIIDDVPVVRQAEVPQTQTVEQTVEVPFTQGVAKNVEVPTAGETTAGAQKHVSDTLTLAKQQVEDVQEPCDVPAKDSETKKENKEAEHKLDKGIELPATKETRADEYYYVSTAKKKTDREALEEAEGRFVDRCSAWQAECKQLTEEICERICIKRAELLGQLDEFSQKIEAHLERKGKGAKGIVVEFTKCCDGMRRVRGQLKALEGGRWSQCGDLSEIAAQRDGINEKINESIQVRKRMREEFRSREREEKQEKQYAAWQLQRAALQADGVQKAFLQ